MNGLRLALAVLVRLGALRHWPVRRVLMKQLYFSGVESLPLVLFTGIAVGGIVISQLHYNFGQSGEAALRLLATITLGELAPLLTALLLAARSSSAMASELALMRLHGELTVLGRMGMDLNAYLVLPRVLGMLLAAGGLTIYFAGAALLTGAIGVAGFAAHHELARLSSIVPLSQLLLCLSKSLVFGTAIATVACTCGLAAGNSGNDVPIAASRAVIRALLTLFALDCGYILVRHYL